MSTNNTTNKLNKVSTFNINNEFKGKSVEPQQKSTQIKNPVGMQTLGKPVAARRMPKAANLPSLKSEFASNTDSNVQIIPQNSSGTTGWSNNNNNTNNNAAVNTTFDDNSNLNDEQKSKSKQIWSTNTPSSSSNSATAAAASTSLSTNLTSPSTVSSKFNHHIITLMNFYLKDFPKLDEISSLTTTITTKTQIKPQPQQQQQQLDDTSVNNSLNNTNTSQQQQSAVSVTQQSTTNTNNGPILKPSNVGNWGTSSRVPSNTSDVNTSDANKLRNSQTMSPPLSTTTPLNTQQQLPPGMPSMPPPPHIYASIPPPSYFMGPTPMVINQQFVLI